MINLYDILDAADGQLFGEPVAQIFSGFNFDPHSIQEGELFVALKTDRGDGHHYMYDAVQAGATGLMCTHPPDFDTSHVTVMIMRDVETALLRWARYILQSFSTTVIAVAGSNGKSSTVDAISEVLETRYRVFNGQSDFAGRLGVPLALSRLRSEHELAVLEFDPQRPGDMAELLGIAVPTVSVVTNISGITQADYSHPLYAELHSLLSSLPADGLAILNYDNPALREFNNQIKAPSLTISVDSDGTSFGADLIAYNLVTALDKTGFDLRYSNNRYLAGWIPLLGAHQIYAALAGLAVGLAFQVPIEEALSALTELEPLPGRMRPHTGLNGCLLIDDSYDANAGSLTAALDWLKAVLPQPSIYETQLGQVSPRGKIFVVLGEIDDLNTRQGINAHALGEKLMSVTSTLVAEGEGAAAIARAALEQGLSLTRIHMTYSPQDSAQAIRDDIGPKDVILIKGSSNAHMERVTEELLANPADRTLLPRHAQRRTDWGERPRLPNWLQIDVDAIAHNVSRIKQIIGANTRLMAIIKADAYGHGSIATATTALINGAEYLGVTGIDEAITLREAGILAPILVMGYTPAYFAPQVISHKLTITLYDQTVARALNRAASGLGERLNVHVRVDMQNGDLGISSDEAVLLFRTLVKLEHIRVEGVYTQLDMSDLDLASRQLRQFEQLSAMLKASDFTFDYFHAADSASALHLPESRLDMVRCGRAIYGLQPDHNWALPADFRPALIWRSVVAQVKRLAGSMSINEQGIPVPIKARTVAILPLGYTDGLRYAGNGGESGNGNELPHVLIKGQFAPFIPPIGAYQTMIDISAMPDVRIGDEVILIGTQGENTISAEQLADWLKLSTIELSSNISARIPRRK